MKHPRAKKTIKVVFLFLCFIGLFFIAPGPIFSQEKTPATTEVTHDAIDYFVPGKRIQLDAEITDDAGIMIVRCYFKAQEEAEFVFVKTKNSDKNHYQAIIPSPSEYTDMLKYLFLVVNKNKQIVKTQIFQVNKNNEKDTPDWQEAGPVGAITVYTELSEAPETIAGFSDLITLDIVESSARFAMVSGIYSASAMATSGGSAAAATSAGTVTAAGGGMSTTAVIATGAAIAGGAGVAAAASGGGGGGGGDEKLNSIASVSWGDDDAPVGDAFQVIVGGKNIGANPTSGSIGIKTERGFPVGDCDLIINCLSALADEGYYIIDLSGGAFFRDNHSTHAQGTLKKGESRTYPVHIPEIAKTTIRW